MTNLKSIDLIVFELLAFNAEKFRGSRDPGYAPFWKFFYRFFIHVNFLKHQSICTLSTCEYVG